MALPMMIGAWRLECGRWWVALVTKPVIAGRIATMPFVPPFWIVNRASLTAARWGPLRARANHDRPGLGCFKKVAEPATLKAV
jgi:hypothetical protein